LARCRSSTFSTTITWNWRGRNSTAAIDSRISVTQPPAPVAPRRGEEAGDVGALGGAREQLARARRTSRR
jgi:hypothetical protein